MNGKQQEWEAVVLIPFIDERRLLDAVRPRYPHMTPDEKARNAHGPMCVFNYSKSPLGAYQAPDYFPPVGINHALQVQPHLQMASSQYALRGYKFNHLAMNSKPLLRQLKLG